MRLLLLFIVFCATGFAKDPLLIGKEVEVTGQYLVNLIPYFDITVLDFKVAGGPPKGYLAARQNYDYIDASTRQYWDRLIAEAMIIKGSAMKLRADCPPEVKRIIEKMNWSYDSRSLEFRDTTPFSNLDEYVAHTKAFIKLVKMEELVNEPIKNIGKTRFHFHMSVMNGRDHREVAERLNALAVLKFIEAGTGDLALTDDFGYNEVTAKGLMRLHSKERLEIRNHFISPEGDARELYRLLTQPEKKSRIELSKEIRKRLTPEAIDLLALYRPGHLVQFIAQTNQDLPDKIAISSDRIFGPLKIAAESPDVVLGEMKMLLNDPAARSIWPTIAAKLQDQLLKNPGVFATRGWENYGELVALIHDRLPPAERRFTVEDTKVLEPLATDHSFSNVVSLVHLAPRSERARLILVDYLSDKWDAGEVIARVTPELLKDPRIRTALLAILPEIPEINYQDFLNHFVAHAETLGRDFLPFLERGKHNEMKAKIIRAKILGLPLPPDCTAVGKV